ncbi:hypothetical protein G6F63_003400 [Rhizopus arrhizus]|uniref:Uncharacterized protein n=1 Tax=Rhizopus oryzae TaxID=64495 RepID=A0A9P6XD00_RHIOR|nr:hypothetical protein G6F23_000161 [Rhizopus arrhizus]KAG1103304.1 hypothetical protein G6F39_001998 [Rhizopus arrhizus]KAG1310892.1 hypothetical protein G6F64_004221 [Rhizopus arrhizus]KAG1350763.1 hypothetical protein G6F63_003400 [Rhizopus arrhizus]KAG1384127.1 hypothetical protein G6F61_000729 [Rhizopus arrhizus]
MDKLINHLNDQIEKINLTTSEIGLSHELKEDKIKSFMEAIEQFASDQCALVEKEKQDIIKATENTHRSILSYKRLMGEYVANTAIIDPNKSLKDNLQEMQQELIQVKEKYNEKLLHVQELHTQLGALSSALGNFVNKNLIATTEIDVSSLAVNSLEDELQRAEHEYANRKALVDHSVNEMCNILATLGLDITQNKRDSLIMEYHLETNPTNKMKLCNMFVSDDNMSWIVQRNAELKEIKEKIEGRKEELTQKLKHLWNRLRINQEECEVFLMANRGLTQEELMCYEQELQRLLVLKQDRIGEFIERAREELKLLWDQLYYSETQRQHFLPAYSSELTDEVLEAHENEISRLRLEVEDSKYILDRIDKYMQLKEEIEEFEASTRDPNRLFGKGQRDPGRLLREEKFRKRVDRELPKLRMELEGSLLEYEALKSRPFLVNGKPYLDVIYEAKETVQQKPAVTTPKTPKRETIPRKPFTSPRTTSNKYHMFNTPQFNRTQTYHTTTELKPTRIDNSISILHRVRERNIRKRPQKPIRKGHFGSDDDDIEEEAEKIIVNQNGRNQAKQTSIKQRQVDAEFESDDNLGVNLDIFDDGPDFSDMSDIDS